MLVFTSCKNKTLRPKEGKGNISYGDTLCFYTSQEINNLFPLFATDLYSHRVGSQIFEPLLRLDPITNEVVGHLAKKTEISGDNKKIKLFLREDVYFHEDPCFSNNPNKLTAFDVKFCLDFACSNNSLNNAGKILSEKIVGGEEHYSQSSKKIGKGVSGIKIINDYCIEINLKEPYVNFQKLLTSASYGMFSKIAFDYYGKKIVNHPIGTGPFIYGERNQKQLILNYNPHYWKKDRYGNHLPYLNALKIKVSENKKTEFDLFRKREIDVVFEVPSESLNFLLGSLQDAQNGSTISHRVLVSPGTSMAYLGFNTTRMPLSNINVRMAIDYMINRDILCNTILNGDGSPALHGFAPTSSYYNNPLIPMRQYDIEKAKKLLEKDGYKNGKKFPPLKMFIAGTKESASLKWGQYICDELRNTLGINVEILTGDFAAREKAIAKNEIDIWSVGWVPDYPDPESYFSLFYNRSKLPGFEASIFPYLSSEYYNQCYYSATIERNVEKRQGLFNSCDSILRSEAIILPILIDDFVAIINLRVRNFKLNPLGIVDFSTVYIKELN